MGVDVATGGWEGGVATGEGFQAVRAGVRSAGEEAHLGGRCVQEGEGEEGEG